MVTKAEAHAVTRDTFLVLFAIFLVATVSPSARADTTAAATTQPAPWYRGIPALPPEQRTPRDDDDDDFLHDASPPEHLEWTEEPARSHELLLKTTLFEARFIGTGANRSSGSTAFQTILKHRDAAGCFKDLLERAHLAGQMYGLCGLYLVDRATYEVAVEPYRESRDRVPTFCYCILQNMNVSTVVREIDSGSWSLSLRRP